MALIRCTLPFPGEIKLQTSAPAMIEESRPETARGPAKLSPVDPRPPSRLATLLRPRQERGRIVPVPLQLWRTEDPPIRPGAVPVLVTPETDAPRQRPVTMPRRRLPARIAGKAIALESLEEPGLATGPMPLIALMSPRGRLLTASPRTKTRPCVQKRPATETGPLRRRPHLLPLVQTVKEAPAREKREL